MASPRRSKLQRRCAGSTEPGYRDLVSDNGREFSRRDLAGWLEGPKASLEDQGFEFGYKGQRLGLPESGSARIKPTSLDKYVVFVQSTSVNRKLIGKTKFLYEVDDWSAD